ncbi:MAG: hypothetical protein HRT87_05845 [Legionellales bacterium]|nr:hypothetical protein [Legionellales bacterium]
MHLIKIIIIYCLFLASVYSNTPSIEDVFNYFKNNPFKMKEGEKVKISKNFYLVSIINIYYLGNKNYSDVEPYYHNRFNEKISATFFQKQSSEEYLEFDVRIMVDEASIYGAKKWNNKQTNAPGYYSEKGIFYSNEMCYRLRLSSINNEISLP